MKRIGFGLFALSLVAGSVFLTQDAAEAKRYGVNAREARQQRRISTGVSNGSLSKREAYRMEKQQAKLNRQEYRMRHDGNGLTAHERARLQREENHTSTHIYDQKHDNNKH